MKMPKVPKRSRLEIYIEILKTVREGTRKPTRIMYKANLSWKSMKTALGSLLEQGMIEDITEGEHTYYEITRKGRNLLNHFERAIELMLSK